MKISIIGDEHMGQSFSYCMEKMGHKIVPLEECEVCWIAIDTPIKDGKGDIEEVLIAAGKIEDKLKEGTLVLCSSQIPVGTSKRIVNILGDKFDYAYIPEHMRVGRGIFDFMNLKQITVGVDNDKQKQTLRELFYGLDVFFTNVATAEMIKHAVNVFHATTVSLINDISDICDVVGAEVADVTKALRKDWRISEEAYLDVSIGYKGGHFDRDLDRKSVV